MNAAGPPRRVFERPAAGFIAATILLVGTFPLAELWIPDPTAHVVVVICAAVLLLAVMAWQLHRQAQIHRDEVAQAVKRTREQSDVALAVSHELRNPLTMIKASAALLDSANPGSLNRQQRDFIRVIQRQTEQGIAICQDLLVQAQLGTGTYRLTLRNTDLVRLVREVGGAAESVLADRSQTLLFDLPRLMEPVALDHRAITQAMSNLLLNASRHSQGGAVLEVKVLDNDDSVAIQVTDSGDGMTPADRDQMFEPFRTSTMAKDGTGLGLTITKRLVEAHGGRIIVDTRLRNGTAVLIILPRSKSE